MLQGILPPTMNALLQQLNSLRREQLDALEEVLSLPTSTNPTKKKLKEVSETTGIAEGDLRFLLSFISFLYSQTEHLRETDAEEKLQDFVNLHYEDGETKAISSILTRLLAFRKQYNQSLNVARLREGFLPNFQAASTFVDIRANFERDENSQFTGDVIELLLITQLRIRMECPDNSDKELVLQIDEESMDILIEELMRAKAKIKILRSRFPTIEQKI